MTSSKGIDPLRRLPEADWEIGRGTFLQYYLYPTIQLVVNKNSTSLIRIYADPEGTRRSTTQIGAYNKQQMVDISRAAEVDESIAKPTPDNVRDAHIRSQAVPTLAASMDVSSSAIEKEDCVMGQHQQKSTKSGVMKEVIFGRNELALHHLHNSLGLDTLEPVE